MKPFQLRGSRIVITVILATLLAPRPALAQPDPYDLSWWTVDGGSSMSSGGVYDLYATGGQPEAATSSGGAYTVVGGFWPGIDSTPAAVTDLIVDKRVDPVTAQPGDTVTYTLVLTATGASTTVQLTDTLASGLTFRGFVSGDATVHPGAPAQIRFNGSVPSRSNIQIVYQAEVNAAVTPGSILFNEAIVTGNDERHVAAAAVAVPHPTPVANLVLIYAIGDNDLATYIINLFQKAEAGAGNPDMVTLLLLDGVDNGDARSYLLQEDQAQDEDCPSIGNPTCDGRYQLGQTMWSWGESTATHTSLKEFLTGAMQAYPAERVLVSLVGHGGGWSPDLLPGQPPFHDEKPNDDPLGGLLWDNNPQSSLSTAELGLALREATAASGRPIDLLYLDACLMAMAEVAYEVKDSVVYLLASENWSWTSFRYDQHLAVDPGLATVDIGRAWIEHESGELRDDGSGDNYPFTYSLLDLRHMDQLSEKLTVLAGALRDALADTDARDQIRAAFTETDCFNSNQDYMIDETDHYCDLWSFVQQLQAQFGDGDPISAAAQEVQSLIADALVVAEEHNNGSPWRQPDQVWAWETLGGISIYLPLGQDDWKRAHYNEAHLRFTADGQWDEFLNEYWGTAAPPASPAACGAACTPVGPEPVLQTSRHTVFLPLILR